MADQACVEVNCCPLKYTVPGLGGTLSLAGDDSTNTDPNIADGEFVLAEEAEWVNGRIPSAGSVYITQYGIAPVPPLTVSDFTNVQVGWYAYAVAICKTFTAVAGSPDITVAALTGSTGIQIGQIIELATDYFVYGTTVLNVVGTTVTLSTNALTSTSGSSTIISFRPTSGPLKIGVNPLIPTGTKVLSVEPDFSFVTLDTATIAPAAMTRLITAFYPADLDPNVFDEAQLFT
jgi:hypothetical protein